MLDLPQIWCIQKSALAGIEAEARRGDTAPALLRRATIKKQAAVARAGESSKQRAAGTHSSLWCYHTPG